MPEGGPTWQDFASGWSLGIYRDPVLCAGAAGVVLGLLGVFVILRRAVFVTAVITQSAGLGVALAFLVHVKLETEVSPLVGAVALSLVAISLLALPLDRLRLPRESFLGFAYLLASASALLVGDRIAAESHDIASILFGTAVVVREEDLLAVAGAGVVGLALVTALYRGFSFAGFDPEGARVQGLPVRFLDLTLWILVALEVSIATRAMGALPVFAFAVLPAMSALAIVSRLHWALAVAGLLGGFTGAAGYLVAYFFSLPVGASQAALSAVVFLGSLPLAALRRD